METRVYPAFGFVIQRNWLSAGEIYNDKNIKDGVITLTGVAPDGAALIDDKKFVWVVAKGEHRYLNLDTGIVHDLPQGWCNLNDPLTAGRQQLTVVQDSEHVCVASEINNGEMPNLTYVRMLSGQSREFPQGTKLYVLEGELQVGAVVFPAMRQVNFSSGAKTATANTEVLALIFGD